MSRGTGKPNVVINECIIKQFPKKIGQGAILVLILALAVVSLIVLFLFKWFVMLDEDDFSVVREHWVCECLKGYKLQDSVCSVEEGNCLFVVNEGFTSTSTTSRSRVCQIPFFPVWGLCICSVWSYDEPPSLQNTKLHDIQNTVMYILRFECWMLEGVVAATARSVQYVYICYRRILSSDYIVPVLILSASYKRRTMHQ